MATIYGIVQTVSTVHFNLFSPKNSCDNPLCVGIRVTLLARLIIKQMEYCYVRM